jgi:hypothetical protein
MERLVWQLNCHTSRNVPRAALTLTFSTRVSKNDF